MKVAEKIGKLEVYHYLVATADFVHAGTKLPFEVDTERYGLREKEKLKPKGKSSPLGLLLVIAIVVGILAFIVARGG